MEMDLEENKQLSESEGEDDAYDDKLNASSGLEEGLPSDGIKWTTLIHNGPEFHPQYEPISEDVRLIYDNVRMSKKLSPQAEELAGFYTRAIDRKPTTLKLFNDNFYYEWCKVMNDEEADLIKLLSKCNFSEFKAYFDRESSRNTRQQRFCLLDGEEQRIKNYRVEAPGLLECCDGNPNMGRLKIRITPEDVIINCSEEFSPKPPEGHEWGKVICNRKVEWLAKWIELVQGKPKYMRLHSASVFGKRNDYEKYKKAQELHRSLDAIRNKYSAGLNASTLRERQYAVAVYFIDRFVFRPGYYQENNSGADTVGCISLRVRNVHLFREKEGKEYVIQFDFIGKQSQRCYKDVAVEKAVYDNLENFTNKDSKEFVFDQLVAESRRGLNQYLSELSSGFMSGLTAKVFRTCNASALLQSKLTEYTNRDDSVKKKEEAYWHAMDDVADLCNHQRGGQRASGGDELSPSASKVYKRKSVHETALYYYTDPRITVAWCIKYGVPIEIIYKGELQKQFSEAIAAKADFTF